MIVPACVVALALLPLPAAAQAPSRAAVDLIAGVLLFADDGTVIEPGGAVAVRVPLAGRLSVGPEVTWVAGVRHTHLVATGNVVWDAAGPGARVTPFLVGGLGVFQTRERFARELHTSTDPSFTAGGGIRVRVTDRLAVGSELRVGWELHVRAGAGVSVRL